MMGAFVRVRGRGALVAGAALVAVAVIGRWSSGGESRSGGAGPTPGERHDGRSRIAAAARLAARRLAARRPADWRFGNVPAVHVRGEVLMDGEPVAGAEVRVASAPGSIEFAATLTDQQGRFDLGYQDPLWIHVVARLGEERGIRDVDLGEHVARGGAWLTIPLEPCETWVTGRLVDRDGRPLAGVPLRERVGEDSPGSVEVGRSAEDGRFRVCGRFVFAGGGSLGRVQLDSGEAGDVTLAPPFTVRGRAIRPDGEPVEGVLLRAVLPVEEEDEVLARSDRAGAWSLEVASGCVHLDAEHRGSYAWVCQQATLDECLGPRALQICGKPGDTVVVPPVVLDGCPGTTRGVVRVGGKPAAGLVVSLHHQRDLTDGLGRFSFACSEGTIEVAGHDVAWTAEEAAAETVLEVDAVAR